VFVVRRTAPGLVVLLAVAILAAACARSSPEPLLITLVTNDVPAPRVRVSGLSTTEAAALSSAQLDAAGWSRLLSVAISADETAPVAGRYAVADNGIDFIPAFAFDPGRTYHVRFDPAHLPMPRSEDPVRATVGLPALPSMDRVHVTAVYPSAGEWPENLLRFYVHFSGPMARQTGAGRVHLIDEAGKEVVDALLPASTDFWSPDQRRYTVLFDPGRVKKGILPNVQMGRALVKGRRYTIAIDAAWLDAAGRPLTDRYQHSFRAGEARESALSLDDWRISAPTAGSRDTLVITAPAPLDHALLGRTVGVALGGAPLEGHVDVTRSETEWRFTPAMPWRSAPHQIVVLSALEDPAGNRIGRAFEVLPNDPAANVDLPEQFVLPLIIR
jgi:hypothetical protein